MKSDHTRKKVEQVQNGGKFISARQTAVCSFPFSLVLSRFFFFLVQVLIMVSLCHSVSPYRSSLLFYLTPPLHATVSLRFVLLLFGICILRLVMIASLLLFVVIILINFILPFFGKYLTWSVFLCVLQTVVITL